MSHDLVPFQPGPLVEDLRSLITSSRRRAAQTINSELVGLYWQVGHRLRTEVLLDERAEYGKQLIEKVAATLSAEFGQGFAWRNLYRMMRFAEVFPDPEILSALRTKLSWTHLRELIAIDDPLKRQFYTEICRLERWSTRTLKAKIDGMLFERTALAKKPTAVIEETLSQLGTQGQITADLVFRDPYILDFLGMPADYSESELEAAILREIETFLLELGSGFCFVWTASTGGFRSQRPPRGTSLPMSSRFNESLWRRSIPLSTASQPLI